MLQTDHSKTGILLSDDLIFTSRITAAVRSHGFHLLTAKSPDQLVDLNAREQPMTVIVDLALLKPEIQTWIDKLRPRGDRPVIVAYGSHVDVDTLRAARQAGCDLVLPRSKFVQELEVAVPNWFSTQTRQ